MVFNRKKNKETKPLTTSANDSFAELAIDVFQTPKEIVIQSPIAGVKSEDIDVSIENDMITISGHRQNQETISEDDYFYQECYWGEFSRTIAMPSQEVDIEKAKAEMENGVLTIRIPRVEKVKTRKLKISSKNED